MRDVGQLIGGRVIGANFGACGDGFSDAVRQPADLAHPFAPEAADDALHLWNEVSLQRIKRDSGGAEYRVLHEHEDKDRQQGAALRYRQGEGFADKPADRLQFSGHHRDDLAGRGPIEMVQRKPQHPFVELIAQPAQHALADLPLFYVQM